MQIIIVADHAWITGGQSKVAIESALGLARRGHDVVFFASAGPIDSRLPASSVKTICLGQGDLATASKPAFLRQMLWNSGAADALGTLLGEIVREDALVHVHAFAKALSPSISTPLKKSKLPCVYTMHEYFMACPNGGFYDYQAQRTCHLKPMSLACVSTNCDSRSYAWKIPRIARHMLLEAAGLKRVFPDVIAISELQYSVIKPFMPGDARWHRVDNPIDAVNSGPKTVHGSDCLYVGRLSPEKGVAHFCAAARLAGVSPLIVGDGPQGAALKAEFPEARFLGWKSPAEVSSLMRSARALVFPSVWYEGQPLTTYEALSLGTPVIVSDVCAGREAVQDGANGMWFASGDVASLAGCLQRMQDDETALAMSANAHKIYWDAPHSLDAHLDALESIYAGMLAGRARAA